MASSSAGARLWRTAFLTLRDETLSSLPPSALLALLSRLILSQPSDALAAAATSLPPPEVTSDVLLLEELASIVSPCEDSAEPLLQILCLIYDVCCRVRLELNSSSWIVMITFLQNTMEGVLGNSKKNNLSSNSRLKAMFEITEILRLVVKGCGRNCLVSETKHLARSLCFLISYLYSELLLIYNADDTPWYATNGVSSKPKGSSSLLEMLISALSLLSDALSKIGPSISESLWGTVVEVLRKVMDFLASKNLVIVDSVMSRFYISLLQCVHLILSDPKGSLSEHVAGFVTTLQMFFAYGLLGRSYLLSTAVESKCKVPDSSVQKFAMDESVRSERVPYRPPHLRRREGNNLSLTPAGSSSDRETSGFSLFSSDSEQSDNDVTLIGGDHYRSSRVRLAAITCVKDLCAAEPKSVTTLWALLMPENDVLQLRKHQQTLMSCLLFDPIMKIKIAASSTLAAMLDGHSVVFLQVAEHRASVKCGSFTTLSGSLGKILTQLHTGILFLIKRESHDGLLTSLFKVLMLLISVTPYDRMPVELLPSLVASVHDWIKINIASKIENSALLGTALSCLGTALSRSPSAHILKMLEEDTSRGLVPSEHEMSLPYLLIQLLELGKHPVITFESLQALKAVSHNYPSIMTGFWKQISSVAFRLLQSLLTTEVSICNSDSWKGNSSKSSGITTERCTVAAIKVIDECLRAASGFKGADDLVEFRLLDIQLMSNITREKRVSSAPSYELNLPDSENKDLTDFSSGVMRWSEIVDKHLPLAINHSSLLVRAAAITCFAGLTSSVFSAMEEEVQEFILSSVVNAALKDNVPSVKSAACRAIGVFATFSHNVYNGNILKRFIHAIEFNTNDSTASVRLTASWALANICDSLRHRAIELQLESCTETVSDFDQIPILVETSLRLTKDGDKIKSNAVRALGHMSRFLRFNCDSWPYELDKLSKESFHLVQNLDFSRSICQSNGSQVSTSCVFNRTLCGDHQWLERMVQAFLSCVTTGNVKVQWNVCHALSNLFMNDTLRIHDMPWAPTVYSILLLLLRDSSNYKIRMHAAVALAVPSSRLDYGNSFCDVVQGLQHVLETFGSHQSVMPSSFKYKDNLEKQLILTTIHVLGFISSEDGPTLHDFLLKKAQFLEGWFKILCSSLMETQDQPSAIVDTSRGNQVDLMASDVTKALVQKALKSLYDVYECSDLRSVAERFENLVKSFS